MKKRSLVTTLATLTLTLVMVAPLTVSATGGSGKNVSKTTSVSGNDVETPKPTAKPTTSTQKTPEKAPDYAATEVKSTADKSFSGVDVNVLWVAEVGKHDVARTGLETFDYATLSPGKTYELAVAITNTDECDVAVPWGIDCEITLPRIIQADSHGKRVDVDVQADDRNENGLWKYTKIHSPALLADEDIALIYKGQSNYAYRLRDGEPDENWPEKARFAWSKDTRLLMDDKILLSTTDQGLWAGTSKIYTFQFETVSLSKWTEFQQEMEANPIKVNVFDAHQSLYHEKRQTVYATISLPEWFRDTAKNDPVHWQIMAQPSISETGEVTLCVRFINNGDTYAVVDSDSMVINPDLVNGSLRRVDFTGAYLGDKTDTAGLYSSLDGKWVCFDWMDFDQKEIDIRLNVSAADELAN